MGGKGNERLGSGGDYGVQQWKILWTQLTVPVGKKMDGGVCVTAKGRIPKSEGSRKVVFRSGTV